MKHYSLKLKIFSDIFHLNVSKIISQPHQQRKKSLKRKNWNSNPRQRKALKLADGEIGSKGWYPYFLMMSRVIFTFAPGCIN